MSIILLNVLIGVLAESYNRGILQSSCLSSFLFRGRCVEHPRRFVAYVCSALWDERMGASRAVVPPGEIAVSAQSLHHVICVEEVSMPKTSGAK